MTDASSVFGAMKYLPLRTFYGEIAALADPHAAEALRARDREMSLAYGPVFCRRPYPGEFPPEYAKHLDRNTYVVVDFLAGKWRRQLGEDERQPRRQRKAAKLSIVKTGTGRDGA
jgi:hypothetical protein